MGVENTAEKSSKSLAAPPCCAGDRCRSAALAGSGRAGRDIPVGQSNFSVWDTPVDRLSPSPPWQTRGARRLQAGRCWGPGSESAAAAADGGDTELLRDPAKGRQAGVALRPSATRRLHLIPGTYCPGDGQHAVIARTETRRGGRRTRHCPVQGWKPPLGRDAGGFLPWVTQEAGGRAKK